MIRSEGMRIASADKVEMNKFNQLQPTELQGAQK
jgi:hypothetical protein